MSDHLPDCFLSEPWNATTNPQVCICDRLRACEQRVADDIWGAIREGSQYKSGFEGGLDAARDAVAAVSVGGQHFWAVGFRDGTEQALAAIDALGTTNP